MNNLRNYNNCNMTIKAKYKKVKNVKPSNSTYKVLIKHIINILRI